MRLLIKALCVAAFCACSAGSAGTTMYKCIENGTTVYQGTRCTGPGSVVTLKPANGTPASVSEAIPASLPDEQSPAAKAKEHVRSMELERKQKDADYEIEKAESELRHLQADLDRDLDKLRIKKQYAKNNLAGATYEQSISTEMQAVSERYKTNIQITQDKLGRLRAEAADLRKDR